MNHLIRKIKTQTIGLIAIAVMVTFTAIACGGGSSTQTTAAVGIPPEKVVDYIHTVLLADRTAYTKHVVNRLKTLEGKEKPNGVIDAEATEGWQETGGVPLPAQMFRLGSEVALENTTEFTYNLISTWYINDSHNPKSEFEKVAMEEVNKTAEPYTGYQEIGGQTYFSALYPDKAVAEACVTCHNTHPVHLERYPDKQFELGEVMGGIIINLPVDKT
ncbi:Protein of unknown function (DUF3365) [Xenococcus sp. PCC 7305]|uniref:Tll0287-like domain-containing protein n=1 Tax=Xenococcus sp. PCC 7305 TaxID=102125 RepID=UPI0002ACBE4F|nr:DUF3365 domain-containing protein [Xenococcus sp. PCC 7305]ELS02393.1 Protein of unknown function (DUF3365) [Xenococcus sp. PCC 7305]